MAYHAPLKLSSKDIPADVILQIAEEIVNISEDPARDIHSFFSTTPALRNQGLAQDLIWKRAHYAQFGPLPRELGLLPESDGFTWRSLVVSRLAIINSERCRLGRGLVQRFRMSPDIRSVTSSLFRAMSLTLPRYTMAQLQTELGYPLLARNVMVEAITLVKPVLRSYTCMPFGSPSVHAAFLYTRAPPYHENLYASLALRGVVVPPFASPILPQTAFGITQVPALDLDARVGRYEYRDRVDFAQQNILRPLKRLILATAHVTSQTIHDITFLDAFLPLARLDHDPSAIWARILGEGKLVESVGARGHVVTMVFSPAHADPQRNPLYWVRRLPMVDELSTIGYAFW